jgi:effector-binding domain-containing protein
VRGHVAHDGIGPFIGEAFGEVMAALGATPPAGMPFARYEMTPDGWDIEAGFPVADPIEASGRVVPSSLPGGTVVTVLYTGSYESLGQVYEELEKWVADNGWQPAGSPWEGYLDGPEVPEPRTLISWPVTRA